MQTYSSRKALYNYKAYLANTTIKHIKVEYNANENPLTNSEQNSIYWLNVNVSNNEKKKTLPRQFKNKNAIQLYVFTLKIVTNE